MRADEATESVSCLLLFFPALSLPFSPPPSRRPVTVSPSLAPLTTASTRATTHLVYPLNTSLSNRLLHFAVCCSCNISALSRSPPMSLIQRHRRRRIDRSSRFDRLDNTYTCAPGTGIRSIELSRSWCAKRLSPLGLQRGEKSAARSLNQRACCVIAEELIREIARRCSPMTGRRKLRLWRIWLREASTFISFFLT